MVDDTKSIILFTILSTIVIPSVATQINAENQSQDEWKGTWVYDSEGTRSDCDISLTKCTHDESHYIVEFTFDINTGMGSATATTSSKTLEEGTYSKPGPDPYALHPYIQEPYSCTLFYQARFSFPVIINELDSNMVEVTFYAYPGDGEIYDYDGTVSRSCSNGESESRKTGIGDIEIYAPVNGIVGPIELKSGAVKSEDYNDEHSSYHWTLTIGGPSQEFKINGKVTDSKGNALSSSKVFLAEYDKMPKINENDKNSPLKKLSVGKPDFKQGTAVSKDGTYEFSVEQSQDKTFPKLVVVSLLWYYDDTFAVTNEDFLEGKKIPLYQVQCIDKDDSTKDRCIQWKQNEGGDYEANVNFVYGDSDTIIKQASFIEKENWNSAGAKDVPTLMSDAGLIYYNSYRAIKYFEDVTNGLNVSFEPVAINIRDTTDPNCIPTKDEPDGAGALYDRSELIKFGGFGNGLPEVTTNGGVVHICDKESSSSAFDAPENREWHELSHYLMAQFYAPNSYSDGTPTVNHAGYKNESTNDSLLEGFAVFGAMLISEHYGDKKPTDYAGWDMADSYKVWGDSTLVKSTGKVTIIHPEYEDFAVAGILWNLHDKGGKKLDPVISKVYTKPVDNISISDKDILKIFRVQQPYTLFDLYNNLVSDPSIVEGVNMIFVDHAAFNDKSVRNLKHDNNSPESPGYTGDDVRIDRKRHPPLAGSYIVASTDASFQVDYVFDPPYDYHNRSNQINLIANEPRYFEMPPQYEHSRAVFSQISSDGKIVVPEAIVIDSDEYWAYIDSNPESDDIFKTIPVSEASSSSDSDANMDTSPSEPPSSQPLSSNELEAQQSSSDSKGGGCLIATAAFGSELAPQVQFLREIRDNTLLETKSGTSFMTAFNAFYYSFSPAVAELERQNPVFKETVKVAITPLLSTLSLLQYVDIDSEAEMIGYGIGIILLNIGMYFVAPALIVFKLKNRK